MFQLNEYSSGVYFPLNCCKIFTSTGKGRWKKCPISMLTELIALSFEISVLIINTSKTYGHVTLFILIWSFKTRSLCWTLLTFEDTMSSRQISEWFWRSVSRFVASRLSKHLHIWILTHLIANVFYVLFLIWLRYYPYISCIFFFPTDCMYFCSSSDFFPRVVCKKVDVVKTQHS